MAIFKSKQDYLDQLAKNKIKRNTAEVKANPTLIAVVKAERIGLHIKRLKDIASEHVTKRWLVNPPEEMK